ncbi:MFS transporter [Margalitia sp. FSL K6-0131]|uniref:MFS transporter n=1 Tax=Margalitia sp. FSL K6-0131 TaxID=2954604 RepID=UPI0030F81C7A
MKRFLWASYGMYFLGGMTSVFFGAILPELLSYYHISYTSGGLLILLQSIGFILGVPLAASCMNRYSYRVVLTGAALTVVLAQLGILFLPTYSWLAVFVILNGIGASSLETAVASYVMELFVGRRAIYMSRLEVAFGLGALCMPAIESVLIALDWWRFSALIVSGFALFLAIVWQTVSISLKPTEDEEGDMDAPMAKAPVFKRKISKYTILMLFLLMIFVYVGIEGSLNSFLPTIFTVNMNSTSYIASLSTTFFWIAMLCGRLMIGWIVRRVSYERYLLGSILMGILFIFLMTRFNTIGVSYILVFGLGLGMSALYSITMVYANHTFPGMERIVTSAVTAFAGIGGAVFPFLLGYMMDHYHPSQVMLIMVVFFLLLFLLFALISMSLRIMRNRRPARDV